MKRPLFKNIVLIIALATGSLHSMAQDVPNGSFENWTNGAPDQWNTTDYTLVGITWDVVTKELANPQSGTASAKLSVVTKTIPFVGTYSIPGAITLGTITMDPINGTANVTGGYPFTGMPQKLTGYFKYQPVNNDTCGMGWALTKWNSGITDTIGYGYIDTMGLFNSWTYFEIPLQYNLWETPDTMNIGIICSNPLDGLTHTGTTLWVDNLQFVYGPVGIDGVTFAHGVKIYGANGGRTLILQPGLDHLTQTEICLTDLSGQVVRRWRKALFADRVDLDVSNCPVGIYVLTIAGSQGIIESRKISILY